MRRNYVLRSSPRRSILSNSAKALSNPCRIRLGLRAGRTGLLPAFDRYGRHAGQVRIPFCRRVLIHVVPRNNALDGTPSRVGREGIMNDNPFASEDYSKEELIAEMGAAMLCGVTGIESRTLGNSAAYLQTWIKKLKSDSRLIVSAASQAQKAADYILGKAAAETYSQRKEKTSSRRRAENGVGSASL